MSNFVFMVYVEQKELIVGTLMPVQSKKMLDLAGSEQGYLRVKVEKDEPSFHERC